jgi:hypothetical protein
MFPVFCLFVLLVIYYLANREGRVSKVGSLKIAPIKSPTQITTQAMEIIAKIFFANFINSPHFDLI